jgi:DNA-directed RNA polymerase subunit M/transcription elongation factor TFIIS
MDEHQSLAVEFILPAEPESAVPEEKSSAGMPRLARCLACGGEKYILASELRRDRSKGIPASRMFECIDCGNYRLG